jgi:hypothetical protein
MRIKANTNTYLKVLHPIIEIKELGIKSSQKILSKIVKRPILRFSAKYFIVVSRSIAKVRHK